MQRPCVKRQLDQETSYINRRQHPWKLHIFLPPWCVQWRDLIYGAGMAWDWQEHTETKGTPFVHSCVQLTGHITAGWIWWLTIFQNDSKSLDKTLMSLIIEERSGRYWRFPKTQTTFHGLISWMERTEGWTDECLNSFELCHKIPTWRTNTHCRKHLDLHVHYELWLKYFTCVKKWRALNHPQFSVKIVCFVSSCGVYALDDH